MFIGQNYVPEGSTRLPYLAISKAGDLGNSRKCEIQRTIIVNTVKKHNFENCQTTFFYNSAYSLN